ncbi:recombinase family protein, partial [Vitreoscilla stercoraria]
MGFGDMKGQIIGYVRVSTVDQNIERQLEQLQHCDELFIDKVSGKDVE